LKTINEFLQRRKEMKSDYYRPADYQIIIHYKCNSCGAETYQESFLDGVGYCFCGGQFVPGGESYPADSNDWDEQRDKDGEWRKRR